MEWSLKGSYEALPWSLARSLSTRSKRTAPGQERHLQARGSIRASDLAEIFLCPLDGAQALGTPDIRQRRKQADTRGVGKLPSSEGAAVDLQLLCLREFQEAFSFPRQSSVGTALLSVLPFTRPAPQRLAPAQNAPGMRPAAASWVPVSRQPVPGQLAAQKRGQKM